LLLIFLFFLFFSNFNLSDKAKSGITFFVGWFLVVFLWLLRNFLLTGYIFFHTLPGIHFLIYTAAYIDSEKRGCDYFESKKTLLKEWDKKIAEKEVLEKRKLGDIESCKIAEKIASDYIFKNPALFIKHSLIHVFKSCFGLHGTALIFLHSGEWINYDKNTTVWDKIKRALCPQNVCWLLKFLVYLELFFLIFVYAGFLGFVFWVLFLSRSNGSIPRRCSGQAHSFQDRGTFSHELVEPFKRDFLYKFDPELFCLLLKNLAIIALFLVVTLAYGCARLRLPIEPILVILACYFWLSFMGKIGLSCE
jgi:hypothetical protein